MMSKAVLFIGLSCLAGALYAQGPSSSAYSQLASQVQSKSDAPRAGILSEIKSAKTLKVCIWPDYFGISYRNPRTGALQGLDIYLSRDLAQELDAKLQYVETDFSRVIQDLENRKCHIAMMGVGKIPERATRVDFSGPYLRSDVYAVTTKANSSIKSWDDIDRPGRVVSVQMGTFMEPLMKKILKEARVSVAQKAGERERDVESGRADVFVTDYPYSQRMLANTDWARVISPVRPIQPTDYAYAVPKGEPDWLARVNLFVTQVQKDGRLERYAKEFNLGPIIVRQ